MNKKGKAWDCGTGNGQVASVLANHFDRVYATDISRQQLEQAPKKKNIEYSIQQAETTNFPDNQFDLVTVAQAIHWFAFDRFYKEVNRTIKDGGALAVFGYGLIQTFPEADAIISRFFHEIVGPYWDEERTYVDTKYRTIPFPYPEIESPEFSSTFEWDFEHVMGYLGTWSAVKHYRTKTERNPMDLIQEELKACWKGKPRTIRFPVFLRMAEINKSIHT